MRSDFFDEYWYNNVWNIMNVFFECGIILIINENDIVIVNWFKFGDNDMFVVKVVGLIDVDMFVILLDIDGLYDGNLCINLEVKRMEWVSEIMFDIEVCVGDIGSGVGIGGMCFKFDVFKIVMVFGIKGFFGQVDVGDILY